MRSVRPAAAAATLVMWLLNLPFALDTGSVDAPPALAWAVTLLGVLGVVSAIGLLRRAGWAGPAVLGVGLLNLTGAAVSLALGGEGAGIGLLLSSVIVALVLLVPRSERRAEAGQMSRPSRSTS